LYQAGLGGTVSCFPNRRWWTPLLSGLFEIPLSSIRSHVEFDEVRVRQMGADCGDAPSGSTLSELKLTY